MPYSHCDACLPATGGHALKEVDHQPSVRREVSKKTATQTERHLNRPLGVGLKSDFLKRGGSTRKHLQNDLATVSELYADAVDRSERLSSVWEQLESEVLGPGGLLQETEDLSFERARCTNELCEEYARRDEASTDVADLKAQLKKREHSVEESRFCLAVLEKQLASRAFACRAASKSLEAFERLSVRSCERAQSELKDLMQDLEDTQRQLHQSRERSLMLRQSLGVEEAACREVMAEVSSLRGEAVERRNALELQEAQLEAREVELKHARRKAQRLDARIHGFKQTMAFHRDFSKSAAQGILSPTAWLHTPSPPSSLSMAQTHKYLCDVTQDCDGVTKRISDAEMKSFECEAEMQALSECRYPTREMLKV